MPSHDGDKKWKREKSPVSLLKRTLISSDQDPPSQPYLTWITSVKALCLNTATLEDQDFNIWMEREEHNSVHSRGLIFKIFNYWPQAPASQNRYLPSDASWTGAYQQNILDETKEAKSSLWPPPGKISTVHVKDSFCHIVYHPKMQK